MAITIGSNIFSLSAQRRLSENTSAYQKSAEKLSSGMRINRPSDDAAGLAIADDLNAKSRILTQGVRNANDSISVLSVVDSALGQLTSITQRLSELAEQSANGSYASKQRSAIDAEGQALRLEFNRIVNSTSFNGINVFSGNNGSPLQTQIGIGDQNALSSSIGAGKGTGTFTFIQTGSINGGGGPTDGALYDVNQDGILDLIRIGGGANQISVQLGNGDGSFNLGTSFTIGGASALSLSIGDVNNDGKADLIIGTSQSNAAFVQVALGNGDGTFTLGVSFSNGGSSGGFATNTVRVGDLDNDGNLDIVTADSLGQIDVYSGAGNGNFSLKRTITTGIYFTPALTLSDLNGDGKLDILVGGGQVGGPSAMRLYTQTASGGFGSGSVISSGSLYRTREVQTGDFNGDGITDIISTGDAAATFYSTAVINYGNGNGTFSSANSINLGGIAGHLAVGDFNSDGITDAIVTNGTLATVLVGGLSGVTTGSSFSAVGSLLTVGDSNSDGSTDIVTLSGTSYSSWKNTNSEGVAILGNFSLKNVADARNAINQFKKERDILSFHTATVGASLSRLTIASQVAGVMSIGFKASESAIRDVDVAAEAANMTRLAIAQQAAVAILAQANQQPAIALRLLNS